MPTRYALISLLVAVFVLSLKSLAAWMTGSLALWSDALESIVNVVTALLTFFALFYSAKPADKNHPYGHAKIEYIVASLQGVFILFTALFIIYEAVMAFKAPILPKFGLFALSLTGLATLANILLYRYLMQKGKANNSPALLAESKHILTDIYTSIAVVIGVIVTFITNIPELDPAIALISALVILASGFSLIKNSIGGLMDEVVDPRETEEIAKIINTHKQEAIEAHDIRHRRAANHVFIEFHLVVKGLMSVDKSHEICDKIEAALKANYQNALITIHVEPEHKAKHHS
jgi:cation diffusion facilitator family transporter